MKIYVNAQKKTGTIHEKHLIYLPKLKCGRAEFLSKSNRFFTLLYYLYLILLFYFFWKILSIYL